MTIDGKTASGVHRLSSGSGSAKRHIDDAGGLLENYEALANAIIIQAVKDYKDCLRRQLRHPGGKEAEGRAQYFEKFFHSSWYEMLTDLDPDRLLSGVRELVKNEEAERRKKRLEQLKKKAEKEQREVRKLLLYLEAEKFSIPEDCFSVLQTLADEEMEVGSCGGR